MKNNTLLGITGSIPMGWTGKSVLIGGVSYKTEIVYDCPNSIALEGHGEFVGKEIVFPLSDGQKRGPEVQPDMGRKHGRIL